MTSSEWGDIFKQHPVLRDHLLTLDMCISSFAACEKERDEALYDVKQLHDAAVETEDKLDRLKAERDACRETTAKLNRRCQLAETAANETVEKCRSAGVSLCRGLANYAAIKAEAENADLSLRLEQMRGALKDQHWKLVNAWAGEHVIPCPVCEMTSTPPGELAREVREGIKRVHDLCFKPIGVGMPGDYSHADRNHAEAHRILDALLAKMGGEG